MRSLVIALLILSSLAALTQSFSRRRFLAPSSALVSENEGNLGEALFELILNPQKKRRYTKTWRGDILNVKEVEKPKIKSYARYKMAPLDWNKIY